MKSKNILILFICFSVLAFLIDPVFQLTKTEWVSFKHADKVFANKVSVAESVLKSSPLRDNTGFDKLYKDLERQGITVLSYSEDSLVSWSDNTVPLNSENIEAVEGYSLVDFLYKSYFCIVDTSTGYRNVALIHLANHFPYENKFLQNGIIKDFRLPQGITVSESKLKNYHPVYLNGEEVFYFTYDRFNQPERNIFKLIATFCFFFAIISLLFFLRTFLKQKSDNKLRVISVLVGIIVFRVLLTFLNISSGFLLFDPLLYATKWAPSFGDLILNTLIFVFITYVVNRFVAIPEKYTHYSFNRTAWISILNVVYLAAFIVVYYTSISLIKHSSIIIVIDNISQMKITALIAYLILVLNYLALFLVATWVLKNLANVKYFKIQINLFVVLSVYMLVSIALKKPVDLYSYIFSFILYPLAWFVLNKVRRENITTTLVLIIFIFSVFILLFSVRLADKKDYQLRQSQAISLSTEHDPIAEYLFSDLSARLESDSIIQDALFSRDFNQFEVSDYLKKNYFSGFWKKYSIRISFCQATDSILVEGGNYYWYPCYSFFGELINYTGMLIQNSSFYFLNTVPGLINYVGWIRYESPDIGEVSLFVELDSRLTTIPLGYPELLLDQSLQDSEENVDYSYAKYYKGKLISHSGDYGYSLISEKLEKESHDDFCQVRANDYQHLIYRSNEETLIVVSKPIRKFIDYLVLFSYIFVLYYLLGSLVIFFFFTRYKQLSLRKSLRNKIQLSIISILIVSLVFIAAGTIWFNVRKYNQNQFRILEEKINSVYADIEQKLSFYDELAPEWKMDDYNDLEQMLVKLSDVFYSDINLYDPAGNLIATSRDEVFQLGLQGKKMNPIAYERMHEEKRARFINQEKINNLFYLSAYIPFVNSQGRIMAYLNLPYFTKQKELQEDITTLTVAIVNIYVLLILLTIIMAVVISNQITKPLEMIQDRFRALKLGGRYEIIEYARNDEIGRLVKEYNNMVLELEKSIELLARSERETAWREMAKQVAHEIKNPLTPMRLSIQQLMRSWNDKKEGFEDYLKRVTSTLIEQIDNLSAIASAFSNFARMPMPNVQEVNLNDVLKAAVDLFVDNKNVAVSLDLGLKELYVKADSDQLNRIFINIIKNGIQAVPESRMPKVVVKLVEESGFALVSIKDNGKGIPDSVKNKLFMPNFTTKTSGMGLGLAIVRNILEGLDGEISFETKLNEGSVFYIKLHVV